MKPSVQEIVSRVENRLIENKISLGAFSRLPTACCITELPVGMLIELYEEIIHQLKISKYNLMATSTCSIMYNILHANDTDISFDIPFDPIDLNCMLIWYYCDVKNPLSFSFPFSFADLDVEDIDYRIDYRIEQMNKILQELKTW